MAFARREHLGDQVHVEHGGLRALGVRRHAARGLRAQDDGRLVQIQLVDAVLQERDQEVLLAAASQ
ncbi:hypothetical protein D3C78_1725530 [compost metagenome]